MTSAELIECLRCENENYGDCGLYESGCKYRFGIYCAYRQMMHEAADAIEAADKRIAELEAQLPKEGEWIPVMRTHSDGTTVHKKEEWYGKLYECSICHYEMIGEDNYCQNCGARMKGANDDC